MKLKKQANLKIGDETFVIKFSGEALGRPGHGIWEQDNLAHVCREIASLHVSHGKDAVPKIAVILGAGNILRGATLKEQAGMIDGVVADECGMRATIINCMILQERLENLHKLETRLMTAWDDRGAGERYIRRRALRHMEKGRLVILAGGTGKPDCSTDRAMTQYGRELGAKMLLKASKVDGIFDRDPHINEGPPPKHLPYLTYKQFLDEPDRFRQILDRGAVTQAEGHGMVIRVFNARRPGSLRGVLYEDEGFQFTDVGPERPDLNGRLGNNKDNAKKKSKKKGSPSELPEASPDPCVTTGSLYPL